MARPLASVELVGSPKRASQTKLSAWPSAFVVRPGQRPSANAEAELVRVATLPPETVSESRLPLAS